MHVADLPGFHEKGYYAPGDLGAGVFDTAAGRIGVAICYDRHFPEYMRALALAGAELVVVPQAGATGEGPPGAPGENHFTNTIRFVPLNRPASRR